jgi:formate hydrogenlyase subunit 6/NADH:ubiquinone oxidoreductase subunit I
MKACPTGAITIVAPRDEVTKKRDLQQFQIDFGICCFCGLCEEACNFSALKMTGKYEYSTLHKEDLTWNVVKLQQAGRDVDYVDTRKKKVEAKPAPAAVAPAVQPEPKGDVPNA